jgi:hypothetical protein
MSTLPPPQGIAVLLADASVFLYRHADGSLDTDLTIHVHPEDAATLHSALQEFGLHAGEQRTLPRSGAVVTAYTSATPETPITADKLSVVVFICDRTERRSTYDPDVVNA